MWCRLLLLLLLSSCAAQSRDQHAADALAGLDALPLASPEVLPEISKGIEAHIEAIAGARRADLPPPTQTPQQILSAPSAYRGDAERRRDDTLSAAGWFGWILAGTAVLAGAIKVTGAGGPVGFLLLSVLENSTQRRARQKTEAVRDGFQVIVEAIEQAPEDCPVRELKKRIAKRLPHQALEPLHEIKDAVVHGG